MGPGTMGGFLPAEEDEEIVTRNPPSTAWFYDNRGLDPAGVKW
jgi:hypothetical protein